MKPDSQPPCQSIFKMTTNAMLVLGYVFSLYDWWWYMHTYTNPSTYVTTDPYQILFQSVQVNKFSCHHHQIQCHWCMDRYQQVLNWINQYPHQNLHQHASSCHYLIRISGIYWACWSLTSLCHSNGHIDTMPAKKLKPSPPWQEFDPCLRTQLRAHHQQVDKTTPQTDQSSGLAELQVDNYLYLKSKRYHVAFMLHPSMSISRFWHYQQLMLQIQMAIWKLAPSIYVLPMHVDMVVSSQVYIYLWRFIDPSCNPHLSLMSMYRKNIGIF